MSNKKYVEITLDKPRRLLLDMNAMAAFEKATEKNFFKFAANISEMSVTDLRAFLWACLLHDDKTLTLEVVGDIIGFANIDEINAKLAEAMTANAPISSGENKSPLA